jgi:protein involved in polysaccharide export with SLBB domain
MYRSTLATGLIVSSLCVTQVAPVIAQERQAQERQFRRAAVPPQYRLEPGDKLEITVDSLPETEKIFQVRSDGMIQHPVAGEVSAAGKTLLQVQNILKSRFQTYLKKPSFRVGIYSVAEIEASAMGEVMKQGKYSLASGASLLDLIAQAGGPTPKADVSAAVFVRGEKEMILDLQNTPRTELAKVKIANGDILMVNAGKRVSVTGEVREPGTFAVSYRSSTPVDDALKSAGGTKETAALHRVLLVRPSLKKPIVMNLNNRDSADKLIDPVEIQDGDIISVQPLRCVVLGGVSKQGAVVLTGNETLFDIVSSVGTGSGRLNEVVVVRAADVDAGTDKREVYNLEEAFKDFKSIPKVPIYDGDVVFVPPQEPGGMFGQGGIWNILSIVGMARSLFAI